MKFKVRFLALFILLSGVGPLSAQYAGKDWAHYHGDPTASHYSQLDQITKDNVGQLKPAWTYHSSLTPVSERSQIQCNPLVIDGVLYGVSPDGFFFAVNAATGEEIWRYDYYGSSNERRRSRARGLAYWSDGEQARLLVALSHRLQVLDPATGQVIDDFGTGGSVDLRQDLGRDPETVGYRFTTPGVVYKDLYIIGGYLSENYGEAPGDIRAYNVLTGELAWSFYTIPKAGEYGADTWLENARQRNGAANVWAGFSLDIERGMVFAPTGSATYDFYGADRIGQNLFANCVIALNANTGERIWHYQTVHHDLWDKDLPAQPNLVTVTHNGERIDAVAQISKSGYVFVLDRETGEPIFPIEEVPVPAAVMDGEQAWPTQPIPSKPPPFARTAMSAADLTDISPEANAYVSLQMKDLLQAELFAPFGTEARLMLPGVIGGGEWGGAAYNPQSGVLYVNSNELPYAITMVKLDDSEDMTPYKRGRNEYARRCSSCHGMDLKGGTHMGFTPPLLGLGERMTKEGLEIIVREGRGRMAGNPRLFRRSTERFDAIAEFLFSTDPNADLKEVEEPEKFIYSDMGHRKLVDHEGYPGIKPPWGTLNAIDLNEGTIKWQVTLGEFEELTQRGVPPTGTENWGGPVATATGLLFIAATADEKIRAFDQVTGIVLWEAALPASGFATPSIYWVDGKQYIVIACGGGKVDRPTADVYVAFALPD
ncbi:MAG: PQQ-binding-like beta-propeller repeat protein [Candidatus Latescibacteria bacterium]|nr:PQQ-binding-like beta-propeller repeat protein [Candidatus Latescibacterota bacterium]